MDDALIALLAEKQIIITLFWFYHEFNGSMPKYRRSTVEV